MLSLVIFYCYLGCRYAECHCAECRYVECRGAAETACKLVWTGSVWQTKWPQIWFSRTK
jgi:hypothetical protein